MGPPLLGVLKCLKRTLASAYAIDPRSLFLVRVALGVLVLVDVETRVGYFDHFLELHAFYGPRGFCPRQWAMGHMQKRAYVPLYGADSITTFKLIFAVQAAAAVCFALGLWTKPCNAVMFYILNAAMRRSPHINSAGDSLLKMALLWMLFMPQIPCSVDQGTLTPRHLRALFTTPPKPILSAATAAFNAQLGIMYLASTLHKSRAAYFHQAYATGAVLQIEHFTMNAPWATFVARNAPTSALELATRVTLFVEIAAGAAIVVPAPLTKRLRTTAHVALCTLQLGFWIHLRLGMFQPIVLVYHAACIPLGDERVREAGNAGNAGRDARPRLVHKLTTAATEVTALAFLALVVLSNVNTMRPPHTDAMLTSTRSGTLLDPAGVYSHTEQLFGTRQIWNMFTFLDPQSNITGRHVWTGTLADGTKVNLLKMKKYTTPRQEAAPWDYQTWRGAFPLMQYRFRKHLHRLLHTNDPVEIAIFARWLCYKYNTLGVRLKSNRSPMASLAMHRVMYHHAAKNKPRTQTMLPTLRCGD